MIAVPYLLTGLIAKMNIDSPRVWLVGYPLLFAVVTVLSRIPIANMSSPHGCEYGVDVSQYFIPERLAFAPLGLIQNKYGNFRFDSLGRPTACPDWIPVSYGFLLYWVVFRVLTKLRLNLNMIKEPFQPSLFNEVKLKYQ